jgi:hypothetical protein
MELLSTLLLLLSLLLFLLTSQTFLANGKTEKRRKTVSTLSRVMINDTYACDVTDTYLFFTFLAFSFLSLASGFVLGSFLRGFLFGFLPCFFLRLLLLPRGLFGYFGIYLTLWHEFL